MQFPHFRTTGRATIVVVLASVAVAAVHTSALTPTARAFPSAESATAAQIKKSKAQHFARVKSDGTLVSGTAISAERFGQGVYLLRFAEPIGECGAAANSAAFPGFDLSVFRIMAQISIGFGSGGTADDFSVGVNLFGADGFNEDSSFTIVLSCP